MALEAFPKALSVATDLHAGPGQISFGDYRLDLIDVAVLTKPGELRLFNFHERNVHYRGHFNRPLDASFMGDLPESLYARGCRHASRDDPRPDVFSNTRFKDLVKFDYAEELNRAAARAGYDFRIIYTPVFECQLFHDADVRKFLKRRHPVQFLDPFPTELTETELRDRISNKKDMGGFVVLQGGMDGKITGEVNDDLCGFCCVKDHPDKDELGESSRSLIEDRYGHDLDRYCKDTLLTVPRMNFKPDTQEAVSVQYLRFLEERRKLTGHEIVHVVAYHELPNLAGFLNKLLQRRHEIKREKNGSYYGFAAVLKNRYPVTRIRSERQLRRRGIGDDILNLTCLGDRDIAPNKRRLSGIKKKRRALRRNCFSFDDDDDSGDEDGRSKNYELIYAVTQKNTNSRIENVSQVTRVRRPPRCGSGIPKLLLLVWLIFFYFIFFFLPIR